MLQWFSPRLPRNASSQQMQKRWLESRSGHIFLRLINLSRVAPYSLECTAAASLSRPDRLKTSARKMAVILYARSIWRHQEKFLAQAARLPSPHGARYARRFFRSHAVSLGRVHRPC